MASGHEPSQQIQMINLAALQNQLHYEGVQNTDAEHIDWALIIEAALDELHVLNANYEQPFR